MLQMSDKMFLLDGNNPAKDPNSKDARHRKTTTEVKELDSGLTEGTLKAQLRKELDEQFMGNRGFFQNLFGTIGKILGGAVQLGVGILAGIGQGIAALISGIASAITGGGFGIFKEIGNATKNIRDGQLQLNSRVDLLSPIQDYGSVYMDRGKEVNGPQVLPMTTQIGPMQGCEMYRNGIRFLDKGLWDIRAQVTFSWVVISTSRATWSVNVHRPDGQLYSFQQSTFYASENTTQTIVSSVVVPDSGYYVTVEVDTLASSRGVLSGPSRNRLSVQHISRSVHGDWSNGNGESDPLSNSQT